jgi:predicted RNA-binding Zn-ribbon protein involved in translation (DUF1610 family)
LSEQTQAGQETDAGTRGPEAQCPECGGWFAVAWDDTLPPGGLWWADSGACPGCGALVCVESECCFRGNTYATPEAS